jgi:mRNA interferase YafQ
MLKPKPSTRFKKNYQLMSRRGYNMSLVDEIIETLLEQKALPPSKRDHALGGNWEGFRECHVLPDWLLIYKVDKQELLLYLERTGTHSDLFR